MKFTLEELRRTTGASIIRKGTYLLFEGVAIDSRLAHRGQLFVALRGERTDGHFFIEDGFSRGAYGALIEENTVPGKVRDRTLLQVEDTVQGLKNIGQRASQRFQGKKIAITGTVGKTTSKHFLRALLESAFATEMTPSSFNTVIGVSSALANFTETNQFAIVEAGISQRGEMATLAEIIQPDTVIFTAFGEGHLEGLGSVAQVIEEKCQLVTPKTRRIYFPGDWKARLPVGSWKESERECFSFGTRRDDDLRISHFSFTLPQMVTQFSVEWDHRLFSWRAPILFPEVLISFLPAFHLALEWGIPQETIQEVLSSWKMPPGRGNTFSPPGGTVIDDSYNANPVSFRKALQLLKFLAREGLYTVLVAGDMLELGDFTERAHRELLTEVLAPPSLGQVVLLGSCFAEVAQRYFPQEVRAGRLSIFSSHQSIQKFLVETLSSRSHWVVLFKGSRAMTMEKAIPEEWRQEDVAQ